MRRFGIAGLAAVLAPLVIAPTGAAARWVVQPMQVPQTPNGQLASVACSGTACNAVGYFIDASGVQQTLAERWSGTSWAVQSTPNPAGATSSTLTGALCSSASACTAVGSFATNPGVKPTRPLVERWNGTSWATVVVQTPTGTVSSLLSGVSCTAATACTAVGTYTTNAGAQLTLAEGWNGTSWTIQSTPNPANASSIRLSGVSCTAGTACTAVGSYLNGVDFQTLSEGWNGTSWAIETTPTPPFSGFTGDSCAAATTCEAVGSVFAESWNGTTWAAQTIATLSSGTLDSLSGVSCTAATACTAGGSFVRYFQIGFAYSFGSQAFVSLPLAERYS